MRNTADADAVAVTPAVTGWAVTGWADRHPVPAVGTSRSGEAAHVTDDRPQAMTYPPTLAGALLAIEQRLLGGTETGEDGMAEEGTLTPRRGS